MISQKNKKLLKIFIFTFFSSVVLSGCSGSKSVVDTNRMPGHKMKSMLQKTQVNTSANSSKTGVSRTKSGVYIYKDNSTVNTTGYEFKFRDKNINPVDMKLDIEKSTLRY